MKHLIRNHLDILENLGTYLQGEKNLWQTRLAFIKIICILLLHHQNFFIEILHSVMYVHTDWYLDYSGENGET